MELRIPGYDKVQGSLTLGGYDASRISSKNVTFPMYQDVSRRFIVDLTTITYIPTGVSTITTSITLMSETISIFIDSTIPYIYLPANICDRFATAFGLQYNDTTEIYTINDTMHTSLQQMNPNITFTLANSAGQTHDIVFPYGAFNMNASFPVVNDTTAYFPLKRAANDTQYTLGRTFLQEAYLIADYQRSTFTVSDCVWPPTFNQDIVTILPPPVNDTSASNNSTTSNHHSSLPVGAIAGGIVGAIVAILIAALLSCFLIFKPHKSKHSKHSPNGFERHDSQAESERPVHRAESNEAMTEYTLYKPELDAQDTETSYDTSVLGSSRGPNSPGDPNPPHYPNLPNYPISPRDPNSPRDQKIDFLQSPSMRSPTTDGGEWERAELESPHLAEMPAIEPVGVEMYSPKEGESREKREDCLSQGPRHKTYYHP